jgi:hypothetical protein
MVDRLHDLQTPRQHGGLRMPRFLGVRDPPLAAENLPPSLPFARVPTAVRPDPSRPITAMDEMLFKLTDGDGAYPAAGAG